MNVYVDSSVLLRVVLGEPGRLKTWHRISNLVSSAIIRAECLRTIDRARLRLDLEDESVMEQRELVLDALRSFQFVSVDESVLLRAADPFPTSLGTLDAIHLSSALLARSQFDDLLLATHDRELAIAARAVGFTVQGS
ncbi:MAG: type II toxin-antitoxin system VapC family toxin [Actinomycetota bacterium]